MGMDALALTDHDGMYGAVRFTLACNHFGVRPILGAELEWGDGYHVVLLARNAKGWSNLCHLVTEMHLATRAQTLPPGKRPRTSFDAIAARSEGLIALSGCSRGELPWLASIGRVEAAEEAARRWMDVFGTDGFGVEITNHLAEPDALRNQRLIDVAGKLGVRTVATNNVHYLDRSDSIVHDVLDCIRRIVPLVRSTAPRTNAELFLKSSEEMVALHSTESIEGTRWISEQCDFSLPLGEFHFPDLPEGRGGPSKGQSPTSVLARRCWEGVRRRFPEVTPKIEERLQHELRMIRSGGFCGYFLLVADIVEHARYKLGIRCACRGSAAGSLVAYVLGISDVDPIHHDLVFERFMNAHRREIPDIDIDFESARREEVLSYILETYGDRTAMVAMMETFRARAALREVGKALGIAEQEIDTVAKAFPHVSAGRIHDALEGLPEVAELDLRSSRLELLFDLASRLDGCPRHLALHPSGIILSDERLGDLMPMQNSYGGFLMSQFDKDDVEALGVAKLDVLGVRMLSSMTHTCDEIERIHGIRPDIDSAFRPSLHPSGSVGGSHEAPPPSGASIGRTPVGSESLGADESPLNEPPTEPPDIQTSSRGRDTPIPPGARTPEGRGMGVSRLQLGDGATWGVIRDSRTLGCFQIESPGQRELLGKFQPDRFEDLLIDISLFRPGPVKSDMVRPFLERRHGFEPVAYPDRSLVPILKETNGVIVYHEQVMRVIVALTGVDLGEADKVRRQLDNTFEAPDPSTGMPARLSPEQEGLKRSVVDRAVARGWDRTKAEQVWDNVLQFASFGFCKAHAAAFAVPTYQSAWLKAHYPAAFYCGILTHDPGMYPRRAILADARTHGIPILPVDVNRSAAEYRVETSEDKEGIRLGLQDIKGISQAEIHSIVEGRLWETFEDFCRRAEVSRPVVEALVHCGGLDEIKGRRSRRELFWRIEEGWAERARARAEQISLDLGESEAGAEQVALPGILDYSPKERVEAELEVLGMDASQHLLSFYSERLEEIGWTPAARLNRMRGNARVVVAGVKVATQTPPVKSGKRVIFLTLEDGTGQADVTLFEEAQKKYARRVFDGWILAVRGTIRRTGAKGVSILGEEVIDLTDSRPDRKLYWSSGGSAGA